MKIIKLKTSIPFGRRLRRFFTLEKLVQAFGKMKQVGTSSPNTVSSNKGEGLLAQIASREPYTTLTESKLRETIQSIVTSIDKSQFEEMITFRKTTNFYIFLKELRDKASFNDEINDMSFMIYCYLRNVNIDEFTFSRIKIRLYDMCNIYYRKSFPQLVKERDLL